MSFFTFFLRDQVPKNVLYFFSLNKKPLYVFISFFCEIMSLIMFFFLFLFLCRSSSLSIEQVMASEICVVVGVDRIR